jgi:hypothetical protein
MKVNNSIANGFATDLLAAIDADAGAGTLKFYTATQPAGPDTAITSQTLLGTATLSDPAGSVSGRVLTFDAITSDSAADATGTCTWARLLDNSGDAIADFTVTATGGGGDIQMNTVSIVAGGPIAVSSGVINF